MAAECKAAKRHARPVKPSTGTCTCTHGSKTNCNCRRPRTSTTQSQCSSCSTRQSRQQHPGVRHMAAECKAAKRHARPAQPSTSTHGSRLSYSYHRSSTGTAQPQRNKCSTRLPGRQCPSVQSMASKCMAEGRLARPPHLSTCTHGNANGLSCSCCRPHTDTAPSQRDSCSTRQPKLRRQSPPRTRTAAAP